MALVLVVLVAGCGGDTTASSAQEVRGSGYAFEAPGGWDVTRSARTVTASEGNEGESVSVTRFRLDRAYARRLAAQVTRELDSVAAALARKLGGRVERRTRPAIAGRPAWAYTLAGARDGTTRLGFVLVGRREYQLLCRGAGDGEACRGLFASFRLR